MAELSVFSKADARIFHDAFYRYEYEPGLGGEIISGPGKFDLVCALFRAETEVVFECIGPAAGRKSEKKVFITSCTALNHSKTLWYILGYLVFNPELGLPYYKTRVEMQYTTASTPRMANGKRGFYRFLRLKEAAN